MHWLYLIDRLWYWWDYRVPTPAVVGLQGAHTCSGGRYSQYSCELLARAPGDCTAPARCACLVYRCPGSPGARDHFEKLCFAFALSWCASVCMWVNVCVSVRMSGCVRLSVCVCDEPLVVGR